MSRSLARIVPQIFRNDLLESSPFRRWVSPFGRNTGGDYLDREFNRMENLMSRMQNEMWRNFNDSPRVPEYFNAGQNVFKIVEEDGKQKMRVQFQAENCKPKDIKIKTKGNLLEIRAKQEESGDNYSSYHEYTQALTLPEGIKSEELTCQFEDGVVTLEAPYTKPTLEAGSDAKTVSIKQAEPVRKEIPIKRETDEKKEWYVISA